MSDFRIVFAGTPEFSVPTLQALHDQGHDLALVLTQPDRPAGRGRKLRPSPVKARALELGLKVGQPQTLRDTSWQQQLADLQPDFLVVVAYGLILPQAVLDIPRMAPVNIHASLLPRWRGAAPIHRAIEAGDPQSGVCLMHMEAGLDTGPVYRCARVDLEPDITTGALHDRLAQLGAEEMVRFLQQVSQEGLPRPTPQAEEGVTYAEKIHKDETWLDWNLPAETLERKVRAFSPWPGTQARVGGQVLKIHQAQALSQQATQPAGHVQHVSAKGLDMACGTGVLRLLQVQKPGGRPVRIQDYLNAHPIEAGA